ncbi:unnamed protein product [Mycena citricolor]|uniref:BTB domain-containing protein n=1 Tax=Mycena citricolor TaxID=2018698 RepID=A0AAD2HQR5_9AGAR|nr:unnamed protein product [Mycena citricolor]
MGVSVTPVRIPTLNQATQSKQFGNLIRSDLWFCDGNVIIIACSVAFKVHRGQLRRHSVVFDDLFSIPQPQDQDLYDGCPWIEVYDCPSDMLYFLKAIYDGLYFKSPGANDFPAVAATLRLSTKYIVESLRQRCISRLDLDWPSTLAGWDQREASATDAQGHYSPRAACPHPVLTIEFAIDLDLRTLLPAAMYDLARYGPSKILSGTAPVKKHSFGATSRQDPAQETDKPRLTTLSPALLVAVYRGREQAQKFLSDFVVEELQGRAPARDCAHSEDSAASRWCRESFYFIMLNVLRSVGGIACGRDADPLFTLVQAVDMLSRTDFSDGHRQCGLKICHPCKVDFAKAANRARERVWKLLPEWFGLEETQPISEESDGEAMDVNVLSEDGIE